MIPKLILCAVVLILTVTRTPGASETLASDSFRSVELEVDGGKRLALVHVPANSKRTNLPIVFVFHGHGGSARQAARSIAIHRYWPEAISVYPQGLNTATPLVDREGKKSGWQLQPGTNGDRDLKFFDALFAHIKSEERVATNQVYVTGHSNGGGFAYLLWFQRGDALTAVASSGAAASFANRLQPKPAMHLMGKRDPLVKPAWQRATIEAVRRVNGCTRKGTSWDDNATLFPSSKGAPLILFQHAGGHEFEPAMGKAIARFFREQNEALRK